MNTAKKYNRIARFYDGHHAFVERQLFVPWRKKFFTPLTGKILDVGVGTGANIDYYNEKTDVIGIDFSENMLTIARKKLALSGRKNITLRQMNVENLQFKDYSFDYVVTSCVFCSVPDPVKGLQEIRRVLKPTGKLVMIEHVLSKNPVIALIENIGNPLSRFLMGANINRNTKQNITHAGLKITEDRNLALFDVFRLFVARKSDKE